MIVITTAFYLLTIIGLKKHGDFARLDLTVQQGLQPVKEDTVIRYDFTLKVNVSDMYFWYTPSNGDLVLRPDWNNDYSKWVSFYSKDNSSLKFWASYSALYNYLHGDQNAYLSSKIEETGKDISYSIKDMNENLGTKMDELIDSINSGKGNMSADELQNAIDKGLEDLNKNTEDIKIILLLSWISSRNRTRFFCRFSV